MLYTVANLEKDKVGMIKNLEKDIGKTMVAFSRQEVKSSELSEEQVAKIKEIEEKLGLTIVALKV